MDPVDETVKINLINQITQHLKLFYYPAFDVTKARLILSSQEIYYRLLTLFPSNLYDSRDVINILLNLGFKPVDMGGMNYEWLMDYDP